ncbi:MAG TPA: polysaccharide biosynthesis/export family protein [Vicinamibacterales bacterium]|jgi:polysaccharide export outer membrane protein
MTTILALVSLIALQSSPTPAGARASSSPEYVVGAQDVLNVTVFGEADISKRYTVDADGTIDFPFIGRVRAAGQTLRQVQDSLVKKLGGGFLVNPQITIEVAEFRSQSIFITGEVRSPGAYPIKGNMTIVEALALAGPTQTASNEIVIVRPKAPAEHSGPLLPGDGDSAETTKVNIRDLQSGKLSLNLVLQPGDTVFVPRAETFFVTGYVRSPGSFVYEPGMQVLQAIALAGGLTERGSNRGMKIMRTVDGRQETVDAKMTDLVKPGDTIVVRQRFF